MPCRSCRSYNDNLLFLFLFIMLLTVAVVTGIRDGGGEATARVLQGHVQYRSLRCFLSVGTLISPLFFSVYRGP